MFKGVFIDDADMKATCCEMQSTVFADIFPKFPSIGVHHKKIITEWVNFSSLNLVGALVKHDEKNHISNIHTFQNNKYFNM